ncbi:NAD kinase, partial [Enterococcus faecalis]
MNVAIVHNSEEKSKQVTKKLTTLLEQNQIQIDNLQPELVISVGGDGTLLSGFHRFNHLLNQVSFFGVDT